MFGGAKKPGSTPATTNNKPETVIGTGTSFVGTITCEGNIRIDGRLEGDVDVLGTLIIGESGQVIATVKAQSVHVAGAIKGEITALQLLEIAPTGKVWGDITTSSLHIEPGGLFRGQSAMTSTIEEPLLLEGPRSTIREEPAV